MHVNAAYGTVHLIRPMRLTAPAGLAQAHLDSEVPFVSPMEEVPEVVGQEVRSLK